MRWPYQQGRLDGLCGVYSLINAYRLVVPSLSHDDAKWLLYECMEKLTGMGSLPETITDGMGINALIKLRREVFTPCYPEVSVTRPFARQRAVMLDAYWSTLSQFFGKRNQAVLIGVSSQRRDHWTVIRAMTLKQLHLFDSDGLTLINKASLSTEGRSPGKVFVHPPPTMLFTRYGGEQGP